MRWRTGFYSVLLLILLPLFMLAAQAHPGKTDANGGHIDHETGEYHYHHGYPAHDHYDMDGDGIKDCPYDFDDQTGQNSGNSNGNSNSSSDNNDFPNTVPPLTSTPSHMSSSSGEDEHFSFYSSEYIIYGISASVLLAGFILLAVQLNRHGKKLVRNIVLTLSVAIGITVIPFALISLKTILIVLSILFSLWCILYFVYYLAVKLLAYLDSKRSKITSRRTYLQSKSHCRSSTSLSSPTGPPIVIQKPAGHQMCNFIWARTILLCNKLTSESSLEQRVCVWTGYLYGITKKIRKQEVIDDIYSYFLETIVPFIPVDYSDTIAARRAQEHYWLIRDVLMQHEIAENSVLDVPALWTIIYTQAFSGYPMYDDTMLDFSHSLDFLAKQASALYQERISP